MLVCRVSQEAVGSGSGALWRGHRCAKYSREAPCHYIWSASWIQAQSNQKAENPPMHVMGARGGIPVWGRRLAGAPLRRLARVHVARGKRRANIRSRRRLGRVPAFGRSELQSRFGTRFEPKVAVSATEGRFSGSRRIVRTLVKRRSTGGPPRDERRRCLSGRFVRLKRHSDPFMPIVALGVIASSVWTSAGNICKDRYR